MSLPATYSYRKFGPAASTIQLASKAGATLGGIWISAKGTNPAFSAFDTASATPALNPVVACTIPTAVGIQNFLGIGCGTGLTVKVASCTGTIMYQPSSTL